MVAREGLRGRNYRASCMARVYPRARRGDPALFAGDDYPVPLPRAHPRGHGGAHAPQQPRHVHRERGLLPRGTTRAGPDLRTGWTSVTSGSARLYFLTRTPDAAASSTSPSPRNVERCGITRRAFEERFELTESAVAVTAGTAGSAWRTAVRYGGDRRGHRAAIEVDLPGHQRRARAGARAARRSTASRSTPRARSSRSSAACAATSWRVRTVYLEIEPLSGGPEPSTPASERHAGASQPARASGSPAALKPPDRPLRSPAERAFRLVRVL